MQCERGRTLCTWFVLKSHRSTTMNRRKIFQFWTLALGEVKHLRRRSKIEVLRQPKHTRRDSIRFMVDLIQRKRKRAPLSKKELKKLKKKKRKAAKADDDESESDSGSSWAFSSDESCEEEEEDESTKQATKRARTGD